jgi:hypothetical protein
MTMPLSMMSRRQLGRRLLEHGADRGDQLLERRLDRLHDLATGDRDRPRQAGDEVAATDLHRQLALERQGGADLDLDFLGGAFADHEVVLLADVGGDRLVELVAADAQRVRDHDAAERDDRDLEVPPPMSMIMFPDGPLIGHVRPRWRPRAAPR